MGSNQPETECLERIEEAFDDVPYPGDDAIVSSRDPEAEAVRQFYRGKHWRDVTLSKLRKEYRDDAFATTVWLTDEAFCFYLPAFLRLLVRHPDYEGLYRTVALYALSPPADLGRAEETRRKCWERWQRPFEMLSSEQRRAIAATIEFLFERDPELFELDDAYERVLYHWTDR